MEPNAYAGAETQQHPLGGRNLESSWALVPYDRSAATMQKGSFTSKRNDTQIVANRHSNGQSNSQEVVQYDSEVRPSRIMLGLPRSIDPRIREFYVLNNIDPDKTPYQGDMNATAVANMNAAWSDNCGTYIPGLPRDVTDGEVVDTVRVGKVFSFNKKSANRGYDTCAAEIAFQTPDVARAFIKVGAEGGVVIRGVSYQVQTSMIKVAPSIKLYQSRILELRGYVSLFICTFCLLAELTLILRSPSKRMKPAVWYVDFLKRNALQFNLLTLREWSTPRGKDVIEFGFVQILGK